MDQQINLRVPGPTPVPDRVLHAQCRQMINHRSPEFSALMQSITGKLKTLFQTQNDIIIYPSSGTGGLEASVVNTLSPGDRVLGLTIGYFGDRYMEIAKEFGIDLIRLEKPWGQVFEGDEVADALRKHGPVKAVIVTHNETSTGATNPIRDISRAVKEYNPESLLLVDSVSGLGSMPLPVDEWQIDIAVTGSQKALMIPPGLAILSVSPLAWQAHEQSKMPRHYWDFSSYRKYMDKHQTPYTPAVSLYYALDEATDMIMEETLEGVLARHRRVANLTRQYIREYESRGLSLFADPDHLSDSVTAVRVADGIDVKQLLKEMKAQGVILGSGQGKHTSEYFRIGHLGWVHEPDIVDVFEKLAIIDSLKSKV